MKIEGPIPSCEFCEILSTAASGEQSFEVGSGGFSQQVQLLEKILSSFCRPNKPTFTQVGIVGILYAIPEQRQKIKTQISSNRTCVM